MRIIIPDQVEDDINLVANRKVRQIQTPFSVLFRGRPFPKVYVVLLTFASCIAALDLTTGLYDGLLAAGIAGLFLLIFFTLNPEMGLLCTIASLPLSSLTIAGASGVTKIIGVIAFTGWLISRLRSRDLIRSIIHWQGLCLLVFFVVSLSSYLRSGDSNTKTLLLRILLGLGLFLFTRDTIRTWQSLKRVLWFFVAVGTSVSILDIGLYSVGFEGALRHSEAVVEVDRIVGMGYAPNNLGKLSVLLLVISAFVPFPKAFRRFRFVAVAILFVLMVLTYSRGATVALLAVLFIYGIQSRDKYSVLIPIFLGAILFLMNAEDFLVRIQSIFIPTERGLRPILWESALRAFLQKPFLGWGLGQSPYAIFQQGLVFQMLESHNTLLDILVSLGLLGVIPFGLAIVSGVRFLLHSVKLTSSMEGGDERGCVKTVFYGCIAYGTAGMFINLLFDPTLYFLMALCPVVLRLSNSKSVAE